MRSVLHSSQFAVDFHGHGGNRRTAQIIELIHDAGFSIREVEPVKSSRLSRYLAGTYLISKHSFKIFPSYKAIGVCGYHYLNYQHSIRQHEDGNLLIWETTNNFVAPYAAKDAGLLVLALPHNLESLVISQTDPFTRETLPASFENEIKHLAMADNVFCISREEQWLLKIRGVNADFLPYYPPRKIFSNLLKIREKRCDSPKQRFLILGTAFNPPTMVGMLEQLRILEQLRHELDFEVDIAGYGTEKLREHCPDDSFNILGAIDSEKLDTLLIHAQAILVHQRAGVGALTRIPEMLIAGVPVVANSNACRSAFNYPGVYCYDSKAELLELLSKKLDTPCLLQRPIEAEARFFKWLTAHA